MAPKADPKIVERNARIAEDRVNGRASLGTLAVQHGVSRERIRQICGAAGVDPESANVAYSKKRSSAAFDQAEKYATVILFRYIAGESPPDIAKSIGTQVKAVQEVLDEQITDEVIAARARNKTKKKYPDAVDGPRDQMDARNDRRWTQERVFDALVNYARESGRLPTSTQYQGVAPGRDDLPSFATVRNRLGRWSSVRVEVNRALREEPNARRV